MKGFYIFIFIVLTVAMQAQGWLSKSAVTAQYAGSTGIASIGFSKVSYRNKLEAGLLYGYLPRTYGGPIHSVVLKGTYNPFRLSISKLAWEPIQTGLFVNQNFGHNLGILWPDKYPKGYYWWTRSTRFHVFAGTQVSFLIDQKHVDRVACYMEVNTNDLYIYSYVPNHHALSLYDILFFGAGVKLYLN